MPVFKIAVFLAGYANGEQLNLERDAQFYVQYFFNPDYGQKAFWAKQTDNEVLLDGEVHDWRFFPPGSLQLDDRGRTAQTVVDAIVQENDLNLRGYSLAIVVLGLNDHVASDGGSISIRVENRWMRAVVMRIGDRFDFVEHEIGHGIGLDHSFGSTLFQTSGEGPGGYGHPHCVMSAKAYGGIPGGGAFLPASPHLGVPDYTGLGPSLNAVSALRRGWVKGPTFHADEGQTREYVLRSRHWGGRNFRSTPQAVEIVSPDGRNYALEFREADDWDRGQDSAMLILTQDRGAVGDQAYPNAAVGTYVSRAKVPLTLGGSGHVRNFNGFGWQITDRSRNDHSLTVRLWPRQAPLVHVQATSRVELISRDILEVGTTTWGPGEKRCVEGTHKYEKVGQTQEAIFEITADIAPGHWAVWKVEHEVIGPIDTHLSILMAVELANPKLRSQPDTRVVELDVRVEATANGSRLVVTSAPNNEKFDLKVEVELHSRIGSVVETFTEGLAGVVYDYGEEFEQRRWRCLLDLSDIGKRFAAYEVLPDWWGKIPKFRRPQFEIYRWVLAQLRSDEKDLGPFEVALADLPLITMVADIAIEVVPRTVMKVEAPEFIDERPAPETDI